MLIGVEGGDVGEGQQVMWRKCKPAILGPGQTALCTFYMEAKND